MAKKEEVKEMKNDSELIDAIRDLTKEIAELKKEQIALKEEIKLKVKAGRF